MALGAESPFAGRELQGEPRAGPASRHIIVEVREQPLEARVEVRGECDEENVEVDLVEAEGSSQPANAKVFAQSERRGRLLVESSACGLDLRRRRRVQPRRVPQELVDLGVGDVEPTEAIVRIRVSCPAPLDGPADACLEDGESIEQVGERWIVDVRSDRHDRSTTVGGFRGRA